MDFAKHHWFFIRFLPNETLYTYNPTINPYQCHASQLTYHSPSPMNSSIQLRYTNIINVMYTIVINNKTINHSTRQISASLQVLCTINGFVKCINTGFYILHHIKTAISQFACSCVKVHFFTSFILRMFCLNFVAVGFILGLYTGVYQVMSQVIF